MDTAPASAQAIARNAIVALGPEIELERLRLREPAVSKAHDITGFEHGDQVSVSLDLNLPADSSLQQAHDVAERVKVAIRALPGVSDALTHLEPLERPIAPNPTAGRDDRQTLVLEEARRQQSPEIADVVVHTEP